jgi:hypothetical protein
LARRENQPEISVKKNTAEIPIATISLRDRDRDIPASVFAIALSSLAVFSLPELYRNDKAMRDGIAAFHLIFTSQLTLMSMIKEKDK